LQEALNFDLIFNKQKAHEAILVHFDRLLWKTSKLEWKPRKSESCLR
jgi:hypothetical protein